MIYILIQLVQWSTSNDGHDHSTRQHRVGKLVSAKGMPIKLGRRHLPEQMIESFLVQSK